MDRTPPTTGNEEIELYIRTYYSLLRSSSAVWVKALEETHAAMNSSLHPRAHDTAPDLGAFIYAYLRLPPVMTETDDVVLGQSEEVFERRGYHSVNHWEGTGAPARRRKMYYNPERRTLAAFVASVSDIDDIIPMVVAFQIEWNKMHALLQNKSVKNRLLESVPDADVFLEADVAEITTALGIGEREWGQLRQLFGTRLRQTLGEIAKRTMDFRINLLASSLTDYRRATQGWWQTIATRADRSYLRYRPVYFVSSNLHSMANLLTCYARREEAKILAYLEAHNPEGLWQAYSAMREGEESDEVDNLLYYAFKYYRADMAERRLWDEEAGVLTIDNPLYLDVGAQIVELSQLLPQHFDPRIKVKNVEKLAQSQALIINVDYPLGMAAYNILSEVISNVGVVRGVYIIGKAATLNARVGDVMIPNVVYDEHSQNTFLFRNAFAAEDVDPYLMRHTVFDNQKAVTVRGTFLQNHTFAGVFHKEGYTDIEMEAGPYLSAMYENIYPKRYPTNEIVNLFINARYDIGVLHYASDTPYSKRQATLSESLSYRGVDSTYACAVAVVRRIFEHELALLAEE